MNDDAQKFVDRATAALRRAHRNLDAMMDVAAANEARMQAEHAKLKASADALARENAELVMRNNSLDAEAKALTDKVVELAARPEEAIAPEEIERILKDRERDLAEFDALLAELRELVGERDA